MEVGVLALQGGFKAHQDVLDQLGVNHRPVKLARDLQELDALILPGGESTTMLKLMEDYRLFEPLNQFAQSGRPVLGTCAGAILMGEKVGNRNQRSLGWLPVTVERNAYGSQQNSFRAPVDCPPWGLEAVPALFIRAPRFTGLKDGVGVLSRTEGDITGVTWRHFTAVTYHPELGGDTLFHRTWMEKNGLWRET